MTLSAEQIQSLASGNPVRITEAGLECILVRADVYARTTSVKYDDSEFSPREAYPFVDRVMADDDKSDPLFEDYQR